MDSKPTMTYKVEGGFFSYNDIFMSFLSDCRSPVIGKIPEKSSFNEIPIWVNGNEFEYQLVLRSGFREVPYHTSPKMSIPQEFQGNLDKLKTEIEKNLDANFENLRNNHYKDLRQSNSYEKNHPEGSGSDPLPAWERAS